MKSRAVRPGSSSMCTTSAGLQKPQHQRLLKSLLTPHLKSLLTPHRGQDEDNPQHARHLMDLNHTVHTITPLKTLYIYINTWINRENLSSSNSETNFSVFYSCTVFCKATRKAKTNLQYYYVSAACCLCQG